MIIEGLKTLLEYFAGERHRHSDQRDSALAALYSALNETKLYLREREDGRRDRQREEQLSRMWLAAAIPLRRFNEDLAVRCLEKSDFWVNPEQWFDDDIRTKRIGIESLTNDAHALMVEGDN